MSNSSKKNDERSEEKQRNRESYKSGRSQRTRDGKKLNVNSGRGKILNLSSKIKSALCTVCEISQDDINHIGIYNQLN